MSHLKYLHKYSRNSSFVLTSAKRGCHTFLQLFILEQKELIYHSKIGTMITLERIDLKTFKIKNTLTDEI